MVAVDGALPALAQLGGAGERRAVEGEMLVDERLGEQRRRTVDDPEGEVVLPGRERLRGDQGGDAGHGTRVPDHQVGRLRAPLGETGGVEEAGQSRPGALAGKPASGQRLLARWTSIDSVRVAWVGGDSGFESVDPGRALGARAGCARSGELEHAADVGAVLGLQSDARRVGSEVVVAIGHAETALQQVGGVLRRIVEVRRNPQPEQPVGVKIRHVQRIDVGAQLSTEEAGEGGLVCERGDRGELGLDRYSPLGLDRGLIHESQVVVAHFAGIGVRRTLRAGCGRGFLDQLPGAAVRLLGEDGESAVGRAVGGDLGRLQPGAVGVSEEVVAGGDGAIDPGQIDPGSGAVGGVGGAEGGRRRKKRQTCEPEGCAEALAVALKWRRSGARWAWTCWTLLQRWRAARRSGSEFAWACLRARGGGVLAPAGHG